MDSPETTLHSSPLPSPATLLPGESFYGKWDGSLNPKVFIEKRYRELAHLIKDWRGYTEDVLKYLEKQGAAILERTVVINKEDEQDSDGKPSYLNSFDAGATTSFLYKDNVVVYSDEDFCVYNPASKPNVIDEFRPFLKEVKDARVSILLSSNGQLYVDSIDFAAPVIDDLALNYGAGFPGIHGQIAEKLNGRGAGLYLLHGPAGTGKTSYIKWLTSVVKREFIFIPVGMAGELSSPSFIKTLLSHKEAILILEDAEQALQSRDVDSYNSSTVSTLLNLTDGVLGSLLNIAIIGSFNSDKSTIDKALLRKGRLAFDYTFNKLSIRDAQKLALHLGRDITITEPTSLADIYNATVNTNYVAPIKRAMGFGASLPTLNR